ncbi:MAG TPA: hypothetical protein VGJ60_06935 [Chloroflexota bacterium]|jgi:hypothetical protein
MSEPVMLERPAVIEVTTRTDGDQALVQIAWPSVGELVLDARAAERLAIELLRASRAAEFDKWLLDWLHESPHFRKPGDAEFLLELFQEWRLERLRPRRGEGSS